MINNSIKIFILLSFLIIITSNIVVADELDQSQTEINGYSRLIRNLSIGAQSFKPSLNILTRLEVLVWKAFVPNCYLTITVRDDLNGNILTTAMVHSTTISPQGPQWVMFDCPDIPLIPEETYYIQLNATMDPLDGDFAWMMSYYNNYSRGQNYGSSDGGLNWHYSITGDGEIVDYSFKTYGFNNLPPEIPIITGSEEGRASEEHTYNFVSLDEDNDDIYYYIDWGDNKTDGWIGPYESGESIDLNHTWGEEGYYVIMAKSKDSFGSESEWATLEIEMPKVVVNPLLSRLIQRFPILEFLL
jgi:hypothetical protein